MQVNKGFLMKSIVFLGLYFISVICYANSIIIDVGHNMKSSGATSAYGDSEFSYNRSFATHLQKSLSLQYDVKTVGLMGDALSLSQRTVDSAYSDFFISIHHDSIQEQHLSHWVYNNKDLKYNDKIKGFSIFVSEKNINFKKSLHCAIVLGDNLVASGFTPNLYHALDIVGERKKLYSKNAVYQYDNLVVLKSAKSPAILVEVGVLTNRQEAQEVLRPEFVDNFNNAIKNTLKICLK